MLLLTGNKNGRAVTTEHGVVALREVVHLGFTGQHDPILPTGKQTRSVSAKM